MALAIDRKLYEQLKAQGPADREIVWPWGTFHWEKRKCEGRPPTVHSGP